LKLSRASRITLVLFLEQLGRGTIISGCSRWVSVSDVSDMCPDPADVLSVTVWNTQLPLVDPSDTPSEQSDVVHYGIQEGDKEALTYSGVFIESVEDGVSAGWGKLISPIA
jgi:hypothetical protein